MKTKKDTNEIMIIDDWKKDQILCSAAIAGVWDMQQAIAYFIDKASKAGSFYDRETALENANRIKRFAQEPKKYFKKILPKLNENAQAALIALNKIMYFDVYLYQLLKKGYVEIAPTGYLELKINLRKLLTLIKRIYAKNPPFKEVETLFSLKKYQCSKNSSKLNPYSKQFIDFLIKLFS